jgi:hypothetical protein
LSCSEDESRIISLEGSIPAEIDHLWSLGTSHPDGL